MPADLIEVSPTANLPYVGDIHFTLITNPRVQSPAADALIQTIRQTLPSKDESTRADSWGEIL